MSEYRDSLSGDESRERFDAACQEAGRRSARALIEMAERGELLTAEESPPSSP